MPHGFIGNFSLISFDARKATDKLHKRCQEILKEAVTAWVKTAEAAIPVWSGMSRGTLVKVGNLVGVHISLFVTPSAAKQVGNRAPFGVAQSTAQLIQEPGRYGFEYTSDVFHLAVNENADATEFGFRLHQPGPYHFREKANQAFNKVVNRRLRRFFFFKIVDFKIKQVKIG